MAKDGNVSNKKSTSPKPSPGGVHGSLLSSKSKKADELQESVDHEVSRLSDLVSSQREHIALLEAELQKQQQTALQVVRTLTESIPAADAAYQSKILAKQQFEREIRQAVLSPHQ